MTEIRNAFADLLVSAFVFKLLERLKEILEVSTKIKNR
jgi:hypothetical protein